ncbi:MAG TPA: trypco2 family protein [Yinghuangia sp.]|nr:trypco2 family protein [Yinghuangia sp.]
MELADMIRQLRRELMAAMAESANEPLRFELGPVEVEASFVVKRESSGDARVRFFVVEAGANGTSGREDTQRVTLTLQPRLASSSASPMISGPQAVGER